jgi:hypothetical protein
VANENKTKLIKKKVLGMNENGTEVFVLRMCKPVLPVAYLCLLYVDNETRPVVFHSPRKDREWKAGEVATTVSTLVSKERKEGKMIGNWGGVGR